MRGNKRYTLFIFVYHNLDLISLDELKYLYTDIRRVLFKYFYLFLMFYLSDISKITFYLSDCYDMDVVFNETKALEHFIKKNPEEGIFLKSAVKVSFENF